MSDDGRIGQEVGRYRIDSVIGQGGFASVYRAQDTVLDRPVALKMLDASALRDPTNSRRFLREGRTAANLDHPAIVGVYDAGDHEGTPWMAMRLVNGGALDHHLAAGRRLSPTETLALIRRIASALDHAHGQGLVHRDVKPSNIILEDKRAEHAWLTDFGIAVTVRNMGLYTTGALGTAAYMAPEQARPNQAGPAADRYSLGCVAYELLTGRRPFPGEDYVALLMAHANEPVPSSGVATIDRFMARAMAKAIDDRPPSGSALAQELAEAVEHTSEDDLAVLAAGAAETATAEAQADGGDAVAPMSPAVSVVPPAHDVGLGDDHAPADPAPGLEAVEVQGPGHAPTVVDESNRTLVQPQAVAAGTQAYAPPAGAAPQVAPQGWQGTTGQQGYPYQPGYSSQDSYPVRQGPSGMSAGPPGVPQAKRRRRGVMWASLGIGVMLLATAAGIYILNQGSVEATQAITDGEAAYYEYPAAWSHDDEDGMVISDEDGTRRIEISHSALDEGDDDAGEELVAREECDGGASELEPADNSDSMASCTSSDGGTTVGAVAYGTYWVFEFDSGVSDARRDRFLESLAFLDPGAA
jgi:tRNA A-37 threonylcarbamoyl transferase component Bud32